MAPVGFLHSIDAVRALAAIAVVAVHMNALVDPDALVLAHLGERGVPIFFVISGLAIEWSMSMGAATTTPRDFLVRRLIRVLPSYWLATLVLAALMIRNGRTPDVLGSLLPSLLLIPHESVHYPGMRWPLLVPGWTLYFELTFYFVFALALAVAAKQRRLLVTLVLLLAVVFGWSVQPQGAIAATLSSSPMLNFVSGMWIAWALRRFGLPPLRLFSSALLGLALFALGSWLGTTSLDLPAMALLVVGILATERLALWRHRVVGALGGSAYGIYIWHTIVSGSIERRLARPLVDALGLSTLVHQGLLIALVVLASMALAFLVDRPLVRALHLAWLRRRPQAAVDRAPTLGAPT